MRHQPAQLATMHRQRPEALLDDIGKIDVPGSMLANLAPLSAQEWTVMRTHPEVGYDLLSRKSTVAGAAELVRPHHEAYDGSDCRRLRGNERARGACPLTVAQAYNSVFRAHAQRPAVRPLLGPTRSATCWACGVRIDRFRSRIVPLFEYACKSCAHEFEALVRAGETPECPACRSTDLERRLSVFAALSGNGSPSDSPIGACGRCGDPRGPGACAVTQ
jgi:putative FmdB family regulatory protein